MAKLIILRGLPASGKSTWARSWCEDPANTWPHCVISLDDIRLMIAGSAQVRNRLQSEHGKRFNDMVVAMGRHMIAGMRNTLIPGMQPNWRYSLNVMAHCGKRGILTFL